MSNFLQLNWNDFAKGLVVAVLTVVVASIGDIVATGALPTVVQLKAIGLAALSAAIAYILKNLFTNSEGKFLAKEPVKELPKEPAKN
jgi:hypothetical protein